MGGGFPILQLLQRKLRKCSDTTATGIIQVKRKATSYRRRNMVHSRSGTASTIPGSEGRGYGVATNRSISFPELQYRSEGETGQYGIESAFCPAYGLSFCLTHFVYSWRVFIVGLGRPWNARARLRTNWIGVSQISTLPSPQRTSYHQYPTTLSHPNYYTYPTVLTRIQL